MNNNAFGTFKEYNGKVTSVRNPKTILYFPNTDRKNIIHPTQKPVSLFEYLIKTYTNEGDTVLDNCAGSGTTAIACIRTNRNYILIEKEKKYVDIAQNRINKELKKGRIF
jgi:DNA modification methylase